MKIDIRDLGGLLDVTRGAHGGTLSSRVRMGASQVHLVSSLPFGFLRQSGLMHSKHLPAGLHSSEGAAGSGKNMDSFCTGVVRACWPSKLLLTNPCAVQTEAKVPGRPPCGGPKCLPNAG